MKRSQILVGIIMGSQSDWPIMKHASDILTNLSIKHEKRVVSHIERPIFYMTMRRVHVIEA